MLTLIALVRNEDTSLRALSGTGIDCKSPLFVHLPNDLVWVDALIDRWTTHVHRVIGGGIKHTLVYHL